MIDDHKMQFKQMMMAVTTLYGKTELNQELLRVWWHKLERFEFKIVSKAFDTWTNDSKRMPTPADIIELCKAEQSRVFSVKLPKPHSSPAAAALHMQEIRKILSMK